MDERRRNRSSWRPSPRRKKAVAEFLPQVFKKLGGLLKKLGDRHRELGRALLPRSYFYPDHRGVRVRRLQFDVVLNDWQEEELEPQEDKGIQEAPLNSIEDWAAATGAAAGAGFQGQTTTDGDQRGRFSGLDEMEHWRRRRRSLRNAPDRIRGWTKIPTMKQRPKRSCLSISPP